MPNNRIHWAVEAVGIAPQGSATYTVIHGLQNATSNVNFNPSQIYEIGQLAVYQNLDEIPDVELQIEKVLDGYPLIYHLATRGSVDNTLAGKSDRKCNVALSIFGDTQNSASGTPIAELNMSGMFVSSLQYSFPVQGESKESVTLVGNHRVWKTSGYTFTGSLFDNTDTPLALASGNGGVQRRQNMVFGTLADTLLPPDIPGVTSSGTKDTVCVQNITVKADLGRTNIFCLGARAPSFRYVEWPVQVATDIEILNKTGDLVDATDATTLSDRTIVIKMADSTKLNLGTRNKLQSISYGGGDTGGANRTTTFSYLTFNELTITHDQNPG